MPKAVLGHSSDKNTSVIVVPKFQATQFIRIFSTIFTRQLKYLPWSLSIFSCKIWNLVKITYIRIKQHGREDKEFLCQKKCKQKFFPQSAVKDWQLSSESSDCQGGRGLEIGILFRGCSSRVLHTHNNWSIFRCILVFSLIKPQMFFFRTI